MKTAIHSWIVLGAIVLAAAVGWAQPTAPEVDPNAAAHLLKCGNRGIRVHGENDVTFSGHLFC